MITYNEVRNAPKLPYRRVYLDQSAYGRMLDDGHFDWRASPMGAVLAECQSKGIAQVWAGPTNIVETVQTSDADRRTALASMLLDLIEAKRVWWGHEFEAVKEFFLFITYFAPDAIRYREYFEHHGTVARQTWLGALALTAATDGSHLGPVVEFLMHTKALNRLLHARFALAPGDWVDQMVAATQNLTTTTIDQLADLDKLSVAEITAEIERLSTSIQKLDKRASAKLDSQRDAIATAYGAIEISSLLRAVFTLPLELELTFNIPHIVNRWNHIQSKTGCQSLPKEVRDADEDSLIGNPQITGVVVDHLIRAAARQPLMTTFLGFQVILREMQRYMVDHRLPESGGLSFDADHAAALTCHEVFVTRDEGLANTLKAMANRIEKWTNGGFRPQVVMNARQLRQVLFQPI
jgi:hypothetical protein